MEFFLNPITQGLTETLYQKTNLASARNRKEFTPKTLEDLGVGGVGVVMNI